MLMTLAAIAGAIIGALYVMMAGKEWRNRDFLGLAFALFLIGCVWGVQVAGVSNSFWAELLSGATTTPDARAWAFYGFIALLTAVITALPVGIVGLVFVLAAKKAE